MSKPLERRIDSFADYRDTMREVLARARRTIAIFDPDLAECRFEQRDNLALLESFCRDATREDALRIVVCSTDYLERECPRLAALLTRYRHRASVRVANEGPCGDIAPVAIVDGVHLLTRFHPDAPRGKLRTDDPASAAGPLLQFETLWLNGASRTIGASLGI